MSVTYWALLAVMVFWAMGAYNRLVRLRAEVAQQFRLLEAQWLRHADMLEASAPTATASAVPGAPADGVEPPAASAARDAGAAGVADAIGPTGATGPAGTPATADTLAAAWWIGLRAALVQFRTSLQAVRNKPFDREAIAALATARNVLDAAWVQLSQAAAAHPPEVTGWSDSLRAQWELNALHNQLAVDAFNQAMEGHNAAVTQFPAQLLAWLFGFRPGRPL